MVGAAHSSGQFLDRRGVELLFRACLGRTGASAFPQASSGDAGADERRETGGGWLSKSVTILNGRSKTLAAKDAKGAQRWLRIFWRALCRLSHPLRLSVLLPQCR